jgi:hypothetical protein
MSSACSFNCVVRSSLPSSLRSVSSLASLSKVVHSPRAGELELIVWYRSDRNDIFTPLLELGGYEEEHGGLTECHQDVVLQCIAYWYFNASIAVTTLRIIPHSPTLHSLGFIAVATDNFMAGNIANICSSISASMLSLSFTYC